MENGRTYNDNKRKNPVSTDKDHPEYTDPEYWAYYYDPRYCSGSRSEYVGRMVSRYSARENVRPKKTNKVVAFLRKVYTYITLWIHSD